MKLSDFIRKLQEIEAKEGGDLPVCLADWSESYKPPVEDVAEVIDVLTSTYDFGEKTGKFVQIGGKGEGWR